MFNSQLVHNEKYLKVKTKYYEDRINKNIHDDEISKEGFDY